MNIINLNKIAARMNEFWQTPCGIAFIVTDDPQTSGLISCNAAAPAALPSAADLSPEEIEANKDTWEAVAPSEPVKTFNFSPCIQFASAAEYIAPSAGEELRRLENKLLDVVSRWLTDAKATDVTKTVLEVTDAFLAEIDNEDAWAIGLNDQELEEQAGAVFDVDAIRMQAAMHLSKFVEQAKVSIIGCEDLANARLTNGASPGHYHLHLTCAEDKEICDPLPIHVEDERFMEDLTVGERAHFSCRICELLTELPFEHIKAIEELETMVSEIEL